MGLPSVLQISVPVVSKSCKVSRLTSLRNSEHVATFTSTGMVRSPHMKKKKSRLYKVIILLFRKSCQKTKTKYLDI